MRTSPQLVRAWSLWQPSVTGMKTRACAMPAGLYQLVWTRRFSSSNQFNTTTTWEVGTPDSFSAPPSIRARNLPSLPTSYMRWDHGAVFVNPRGRVSGRLY